MKRIAISFVALILSVMAYAFEQYTAYCQVRAEWRGNYYIAFDSDVTNTIKSGKGFTVVLTDENGTEIKSENCMDIVNYLSKHGWKVVGTSTWSSGGEMNLVYFYTMEKAVSSEAELTTGIRLLAK